MIGWTNTKRMIQPKSMTLCITATELHAYPRIPMTRIRNTNVKIPANPEYALYMEKSKISLAVIFT